MSIENRITPPIAPSKIDEIETMNSVIIVQIPPTISIGKITSINEPMRSEHQSKQDEMGCADGCPTGCFLDPRCETSDLLCFRYIICYSLYLSCFSEL